MKSFLIKTACVIVLVGAAAFGQPALSIPEHNDPCAAGAGTDTVVSAPDHYGFIDLFDGKTLKGWWESCKTGHSSSDNVNGGIYMADPANEALYSQQQANGAGGVLMTNKIFGNYELIFDYWGTYGDDGGVFNRTSATGKCYQTTLDYIAGSSVGGAYGEAGYTNLNIDPYVFGGNKNTITNLANWTAGTKAQNPTSFGCPAAGCTAADWATVWDPNGWNQIRIKFYGGLTSASKVKMKTYFRKSKNGPVPGLMNWVPVYTDSQSIVTPASYIGFQIHGGTARWVRGAGTWYKNIKWRPLDDQGNTIGVPDTIPYYSIGTTAIPSRSQSPLMGARLLGNTYGISGHIASTHQIIVRDVTGHVLETFRGEAGDVNYSFTNSARGLMVVEVKTAAGTDRIPVARF